MKIQTGVAIPLDGGGFISITQHSYKTPTGKQGDHIKIELLDMNAIKDVDHKFIVDNKDTALKVNIIDNKET
jgi:hypothetical protein